LEEFERESLELGVSTETSALKALEEYHEKIKRALAFCLHPLSNPLKETLQPRIAFVLAKRKLLIYDDFKKTQGIL